MELSQARRIVNGALRRMRAHLWIQNWTIDVVYEKLDDGTMGLCTPDPRYRRASISLDLAEIETADKLLEVLRHELIHVVLAPYLAFRRMAYQFTPSKEVDDALDVAYQLAEENVLQTLESIFDAWEWTAEAMAEYTT